MNAKIKKVNALGGSPTGIFKTSSFLNLCQRNIYVILNPKNFNSQSNPSFPVNGVWMVSLWGPVIPPHVWCLEA